MSRPGRKKQPKELRASLLSSASSIIVQNGIHSLTLDAVAKRAGVSKGGLLHHFESRQALLDALYMESLSQFKDSIDACQSEDTRPKGIEVRAYLKVSTKEPVDSGLDLLRVLIAVMLTEPASRERWSREFQRLITPESAATEETVLLTICRLAVDGLWISEMLGISPMSASLKAKVLRKLEDLTHS